MESCREWNLPVGNVLRREEIHVSCFNSHWYKVWEKREFGGGRRRRRLVKKSMEGGFLFKEERERKSQKMRKLKIRLFPERE